VYLLNLAFAPGMMALRQLVRVDDAAATAANILAHATLFRLGFTGNLVAVAAYIVVTALLYKIFAAVDKTVSLVAALLSAAGCIIIAVGTACYITSLNVLTSAGPASMPQAQAFALMLIKLYSQCYNTSLLFFGLYLILIGVLTYRSTFLPRALGVALIAAGPGWLAFLWPPLARALFPYLLVTDIGELALVVWLIVKGVNSERWYEQSRMPTI
jgi:hypothetical protein